MYKDVKFSRKKLWQTTWTIFRELWEELRFTNGAAGNDNNYHLLSALTDGEEL